MVQCAIGHTSLDFRTDGSKVGSMLKITAYALALVALSDPARVVLNVELLRIARRRMPELFDSEFALANIEAEILDF